MQIPPALVERLTDWAGKDRATVARLYEEYRHLPDFPAVLIALTETRGAADGATWLLKAWLEAGGALEPGLLSPLLKAAALSDSWQTRLHTLQLLPRLGLDASHQPLVEPLVRAGLESDRTFVRAWALDGFWELARLCPNLREEAERRIDEADNTGPASVRARIQAIRKRPF